LNTLREALADFRTEHVQERPSLDAAHVRDSTRKSLSSSSVQASGVQMSTAISPRGNNFHANTSPGDFPSTSRHRREVSSGGTSSTWVSITSKLNRFPYAVPIVRNRLSTSLETKLPRVDSSQTISMHRPPSADPTQSDSRLSSDSEVLEHSHTYPPSPSPHHPPPGLGTSPGKETPWSFPNWLKQHSPHPSLSLPRLNLSRRVCETISSPLSMNASEASLGRMAESEEEGQMVGASSIEDDEDEGQLRDQFRVQFSLPESESVLYRE
jgi:hypothetical protein